MLHCTPDILQWKDSEAELQTIHQTYLDAVCDGVGALLAKLKIDHSRLFAEISGLLNQMPTESLNRVLTAPEFTYRIFFRRQHQIEVGEFLRQALEIEMTRDGLLTTPSGWSALGDYGVAVDRLPLAAEAFRRGDRVLASPRLGGRLPVDFLSPYATKISLNDDEYGVVHHDTLATVNFYSPDEMARLVDALSAVHEAIGDVQPNARHVVENFSKVVVVRRDDADAQSFTSSSSGQYTCRTMIVNPHLSDAGGSILADALVHESIHGVLYMNERVSPWVLHKELYIAPSARLVSPWSGRDLLLRPFLQACFVWYGLLIFWSSARAESAFGKSATEYCRVRALRGFELGQLVERLSPWKLFLSDEVLATIDELQRRVLSAYR